MSAPITITIPHKLGKAEARRRIGDGFSRLGQQLAAGPITGMQQAWDGDRLGFSAHAVGQRVSGRLDVGETDIRIEVDLPPLLAGLADIIAGRLRKQGRLLLEKK